MQRNPPAGEGAPYSACGQGSRELEHAKRMDWWLFHFQTWAEGALLTLRA
jgi:hypothetical protein